MTCYIFGAGTPPKTKPDIKSGLVIAADGGLETLNRFGINADIVIGDFDSMSLVSGQNVIRLKAEKDETDMLAACNIALEKGADEIIIYGGLGGSRLSHTLANFQLIASLSQKGVKAHLLMDGLCVTAITDCSHKLKNAGGYVSVFCHTDTATGVTLTGFKYPLSNATLYNNYPLGVSNQIIADSALVTVKSGTLIIIYGERL